MRYENITKIIFKKNMDNYILLLPTSETEKESIIYLM